MTINDFRGQVKIADVQAAFDEIVGRINSMVDKYNGAVDLEDIDYTKGSPLLAASGYTLTVGGLKQVLNSYNNSTIGCRVYKISGDEVLISDGVHIKDGIPHRIQAQVAGGIGSPSVTPDSSASYYSYSDYVSSGLYSGHVPQIKNKSETVVSGAAFNHANTVPFEWEKIYIIPAGEYPRYGVASAYSGRYKFSEYNKSLGKIVPTATFNAIGNVPYILGITHDDTGEVVTDSTYSLTQSNTGSLNVGLVDTTKGYHLLVQKHEDTNGVKLYMVAFVNNLDTPTSYSVILSGGEEFRNILDRCEYIQRCDGNNSNSSIASLIGYYNVNGTLSDYTSYTQLGTIQYYPASRPSTGVLDVSNLYLNTLTDSILFKSWGDSDSPSSIVTVPTTYTQPDIDSNTYYGVFTATDKSQDAYKVTSSEESWEINTKKSGTSSVTWNFESAITITNVSFNYNSVGFKGIINVYAGKRKVYSKTVEGTEESAVSKNISNVKCNSLRIDIVREEDSAEDISTLAINNLLLSGSVDEYAIDDGNTITLMSDIAKLWTLNWDSGDIVLNSIEDIQLEEIDGVSITTQDRKIRPKGYGSWDSLSNSSSGKFVAYTSSFHNYNYSQSGTTTFMGLLLNGEGVHSNDPDRHHYRAQALSLIYIPKGFAPTDSRTNHGARWVYTMKLNK